MAYVSTLDLRIPIEFYVNPSFCQDLSLLDEDNIIPFFGGLCIALGGLTQEAALARFRSMDITFIEAADTQDTFYDRLAPLIFLYIYSAYPRNHTDSFVKYQANKAIGFMRNAENFGYVYDKQSLSIDADTLTALKDFMDTHSSFCSFACQIFIAFLNPKTGNAVHSYAIELKEAVSYANMVGVKMIKEEIIDKAHPIAGNTEVSRALQYYNTFVNDAKRRHGPNWTFIALLEKHKWSAYSRENHFRQLWIIAGIIGSPDNIGYAKMMVQGESIASYSTKPHYSDLITRYNHVARNIVVESSEHSKSTNERINSFILNWNRADHHSSASVRSGISDFSLH